MKAIKSFFIVALFCVSLATTAQTSVNSAGGNSTNANGTVSYSVGQVVYTTSVGTGGTVAHGVQQPYELFVISGIEDAKGIDLAIKTYPNPATDYLIVKVQETSLKNLNYQLVDVSGKMLISNKIAGDEAKLKMSQFVAGTYFLRLYSDKREVKVFKIIKN